MDKTESFQFIKHTDLDSVKWNRCIDNASNCRVYAYDWHLDRTALVWDALVWGDYEYVMPLTRRTKLGIKYLYQPNFSQQLGIFPTPPAKVSVAFLDYIYSNFRYCDITVNSENLPTAHTGKFQFIPRNNFLLPLNKDFDSLTDSFSNHAKRNISKAQKQKLSLIEGISLQAYLAFKEETATADVNNDSLICLKSLIAHGHSKGFGKIYGVYSATNQLCAAVYFCHWKNRVIYFNAASNKEGKAQGAMYFLLYKFIKQNAGKDMILDFEGSMVPGIARFFGGFGAKPEHYFQLKFNRLPLPLKWIKR